MGVSDLVEGWLCQCGHWEESGFHCSNCGAEPPWGCDCGAHGDELEEGPNTGPSDAGVGIDLEW